MPITSFYLHYKPLIFTCSIPQLEYVSFDGNSSLCYKFDTYGITVDVEEQKVVLKHMNSN
jgi:hypothetical protein